MQTLITDRLNQIKAMMQERGIQYYLITTADYHSSEYPGDYFKEREFMSGFTGSNGNLLIGEETGLWTDGRYFIQAEKELEGSGITLFRMGEEGVPAITEYLEEHLEAGKAVAFNGRTIPVSLGQKLEALAEKKGAALIYDVDFVDCLWQDRPEIPHGPVMILEDAICGKTPEDKLSEVKEAMRKAECKAFVLSKLDDIMWLFNIRGKDVDCNPVALSYAVVEENKSFLFLQKQAITEDIKKWAEAHAIELHDYAEITDFLNTHDFGGKVWLDKGNASYTIYKLVGDRNELHFDTNPTELMKAMKNPEELRQMKEVYLKDSLAVCRFMKWLKETIGKEAVTELSAARYMDDLRRNTESFLDLSFPTICGYKENAAMMHYQATEGCYKELESEGMLLIDSGGQYMGGTTDVTRTIAVGAVSEEVKKHFTAVAMGMLRLQNGKFLQGCTGRNVDILAREPLWEMGIDYKCGTGHGIGYILNVHEGPQNIRWRFGEGMTEAVLEEGMVLSNEPGVYIEGSHGIRTENIMVVKKGVKNGDGQFMEFEALTYVPIDLDLIDPVFLEPKDKERLNRYHREVYEKISPKMTEEERAWLKEATREIL